MIFWWLRPARLIEFGLLAAIEDLTGFWRARRHDVVFRVDLREGDIPEGVEEIVYRIATRAHSAGAQGYVSKDASPEELQVAVRRAASGGRYVERVIAQAMAVQAATPFATLAQFAQRDLEILRRLASGKSLSEIADAFGLGYKTIVNDCSIIKTKLGVSRTADLLRLALEAGLSRFGECSDIEPSKSLRHVAALAL